MIFCSVGRLQGHKIYSSRLVHREVLEPQSNSKKSCGALTGSNGVERDWVSVFFELV